jgi:hypothetical protein
MTLAQFTAKLDGWGELRKGDNIEDWRRARAVGSFTLAIGQWKDGKAPDIMKIMPLPGDAAPEPELIEVSDEEMAEHKYRIKRARRVNFNQEFEDLIRRHYRQEWGPHPDTLT